MSCSEVAHYASRVIMHADSKIRYEEMDDILCVASQECSLDEVKALQDTIGDHLLSTLSPANDRHF